MASGLAVGWGRGGECQLRHLPADGSRRGTGQVLCCCSARWVLAHRARQQRNNPACCSASCQCCKPPPWHSPTTTTTCRMLLCMRPFCPHCPPAICRVLAVSVLLVRLQRLRIKTAPSACLWRSCGCLGFCSSCPAGLRRTQASPSWRPRQMPTPPLVCRQHLQARWGRVAPRAQRLALAAAAAGGGVGAVHLSAHRVAVTHLPWTAAAAPLLSHPGGGGAAVMLALGPHQHQYRLAAAAAGGGHFPRPAQPMMTATAAAAAAAPKL